MFIVAEGEIIVFNEDGENEVLSEGAIIGVENLLFNKKWDCDMFCGVTAIVSKLRWENLLDMVKANAAAASKIYKCAMRHYCYKQLYDSGKKVQNQHLFNFKNIADVDLMIDFKLKMKDTKDKHLFNLLSQARQPTEIGIRESKAEAINTMPYFLTSEYAKIMQESKR